MKSFLKKYYPFVIIFCSLLIFSPALFNFFSSDDWFHLRISQIGNLHEFFDFFSFLPNQHSATFYRPLSTQVFFFIFQKLFGLNAGPYYLFVFLVFGFSLWLVYRLARIVFKNKKQSLLALVFYAFSVTHFTRLYFLSAFQEILMTVFVLSAVLTYFKKPSWKTNLLTSFFFILALLSKETAVVLPLILILFDWFNDCFRPKRLIPILLILFPYLYFRFFHFGQVSGDSYLWDFSVRKFLNTFFWYALWSFGAPELLVDYVSGGLRILPRFFSDFPFWSKIVLSLIGSTLTSFAILFVANLKKVKVKKVLLFLGIFFLALLPVLFLPRHKFTLELTLPMVSFSFLLAEICLTKHSWLTTVFISLYIILNLSMNRLTYQTHYTVSRSQIAKKVYHYFIRNYPQYPEGCYFEFTNDQEVGNKIWGVSKQVAFAVGDDNFFQVLYHNQKVKVFYQDLPEERPKDKQVININSTNFLP